MSETTTNLNRLIDVCRDGEKGFQEAAQQVDNGEYKKMFTELARQRGQFATELQQLVTGMGEKPNEGGTARAAMHRALLDLKAKVTGGSTKAVLEEVERGEDVAVGTYKEVANTSMPDQARDMVMRQFAAVKEAHDRVKALRDIQ